ncbi:hypothetical protein D3C85_1273690 [compost metagenome]
MQEPVALAGRQVVALPQVARRPWVPAWLQAWLQALVLPLAWARAWEAAVSRPTHPPPAAVAPRPVAPVAAAVARPPVVPGGKTRWSSAEFAAPRLATPGLAAGPARKSPRRAMPTPAIPAQRLRAGSRRQPVPAAGAPGRAVHDEVGRDRPTHPAPGAEGTHVYSLLSGRCPWFISWVMALFYGRQKS